MESSIKYFAYLEILFLIYFCKMFYYLAVKKDFQPIISIIVNLRYYSIYNHSLVRDIVHYFYELLSIVEHESSSKYIFLFFVGFLISMYVNTTYMSIYVCMYECL